jgi:ATP-binding protein involved in chromosome partitioning
VKLMSIGFLLDDPIGGGLARPDAAQRAAAIFEGRRLGRLDFLLLDLPPGTGDVALTLSQRVRSTAP